MLNPDQVPPAGPTYIYGEKKRKGRGELLRSAGKQIQQPQYPNDVNATGITTYNIKMKETIF